MKKLIPISGIFFFALSFFGGVNAQETYRPCGTSEYYNELIKTHPEILEVEKKQNEYIKKYKESLGQERSSGPVYIIPVVFHVLHEYGPENISKAQILDAMNILNRDYRKLNADTIDVVTSFKPLVADIEIEFRLATIDPNGNCTDGIERIFSIETNNGDNGAKLNQWPRDKYLNVWVVKDIASGAAGYSQYPGNVLGAQSVNDGVMILSTYIGSIGTGTIGTSRALTHEVGHYLDLIHCWGSTNSPGIACGGSDFCGDTPETKGWQNCTLSGSVCNPPIIENVQNYMEYAYCSRMFTLDQRDRMRAALTNTALYPFRANLWSASNLAATGALASPAPICYPVCDYDSHKLFICAGTTYNFKDASYRGTPTSWLWSFPGGTPSSSTDTNPTVTYNTPGIYDVELTVSNSSGAHTITRIGHVNVTYPWSFVTVPVSESFETINVPGNDWYVENLNGGNTWVKTSSVGKTGTSSMTKNNFTSSAAGGVDAFITSSYDFTNIYAGSLTFQLAFAIRTNPTPPATVKDKLIVYSSSDCGKSWSLRYSKSGLALSTAGIIANTAFTPNSSQWAMQTISLANGQVTNKPNLRFKFEYTYDVGNNIYIDDINITGSVGLNEAQTTQINLSVTPNPASSAPAISFNLIKAQKISVIVTDILGQKVEGIEERFFEEGVHQYQLNADLKSGVYFVQLYLGDQVITKKAVIE